MKKVIMFSLLLGVTGNVSAVLMLTEASATGITVKFSTKLSEKLPTGYKVKIDYGNGKGLVAMTCSGLSCTLSSNTLPVGVNQANYKIGIYNAQGVLQNDSIDASYIIASITIRLNEKTDIKRISSAEFAKFSLIELSLITTAQAQGLSAAQIATLTEKNVIGLVGQLEFINPVLISSFSKKVIPFLPVINLTIKQVAFFTPEQLAAFIPKQIAAFTPEQLGALTSEQVGALTLIQISALTSEQVTAFTPEQVAIFTPKQLAAFTPEQISAFTFIQIAALTYTQIADLTTEQVAAFVSVKTIPIKTIGYSKISNLGETLPDKAVLGTGLKDWACTKDNKTGLIWEVKTQFLFDLRYFGNKYSWYEPDANKNGGYAGTKKTTAYSPISYGNTYDFVKDVNAQGLCGKKDWRIPTWDELRGLETQKSTYLRYIDANYFPFTAGVYWTSNSGHDYYYPDNTYALIVDFEDHSNPYGTIYEKKYDVKYIRLVR